MNVVIDLQEGDTEEEAHAEAQRQVEGQLALFKAREAAEREAYSLAHQEWRVTPDMVAEVPTLREKALMAFRLEQEHRDVDYVSRAHEKALKQFGMDLQFIQQPDGSALAKMDDLTLLYKGGDFQVIVPIKDEPSRTFSWITSLEQLGKQLAALESVGGEKEDLPF